MVKCTGVFSQLLGVVSRQEFAALVAKHKAERRAKGFGCWTQFVAMLFCQMGRADSLREICNGLSCCMGKLVHLGLRDAPKKSTLAYANQHRPAALYEDLFWMLLRQLRDKGNLAGRKSQFRFKNKLFLMDSTTISLCLGLFPWAEFRQAKGGVKLHIMLDHADYMPAFVLITEAKQHDVKAARQLPLTKDSIVVEDRGYIDFKQWNQWTGEGVYFVSRLKDNAAYEVVEEKDVPKNRNILADQVIALTGPKSREDYPGHLRRVVVWDKQGERELVLVTNHMGFGSTTIAAIYKERWQIELFFKALKQNLKIKTFVGTTENALRIQIWTALIALLIIRWLHHRSKAGWSLSGMASMLRLVLFTHRPLMEWLDDPYGVPPTDPDDGQPGLPFPDFGQQTAA